MKWRNVTTGRYLVWSLLCMVMQWFRNVRPLNLRHAPSIMSPTSKIIFLFRLRWNWTMISQTPIWSHTHVMPLLICLNITETFLEYFHLYPSTEQKVDTVNDTVSWFWGRATTPKQLVQPGCHTKGMCWPTIRGIH